MVLTPPTSVDHNLIRRLVDEFNQDDRCPVINLIPNSESFDWILDQCPLFDCPDPQIRTIYYFRWWVYRKHIKRTPHGRIVTEFITPVSHASSYNAISCALGLHLAEGRWLADQTLLNEYVNFWFTAGETGGLARKFHNYSSWLHWAEWQRYLVTGDRSYILSQFDRFVADYELWEAEKRLPNGLFWQYDVRDGMEESISGSRIHKNARPTINSYMYANAIALARIARLAGRADLVERFEEKAQTLRKLVHEHLWDEKDSFFKAQKDENGLSDARELIGYIPWCFNLPYSGTESAWKYLVDEKCFWAPAGLTTADRSHPMFRSHGVGQCEWDGAVWPFATSQTLIALANALRNYASCCLTRETWFKAFQTYTASHVMYDKPYIGEYHDEIMGLWLKGDNPRSIHYNHSTFADLVIHGLVGFIPREDGLVELDPLLPSGLWDWFILDNIHYQGRTLKVIWDRDGSHFGTMPGLSVWQGNQRLIHSEQLTRTLEEGP
ncbi:MAG: hypothetical protein KatS3mg104_0729 [Phycisphaerae bacterium]|jgi:hypothetical protein|nr:MAG: hypothetical protein KatS3mg104_0729 [Phycisphaerae bacterium]